MAHPVSGIKVNENGIPNFQDLPLRKGDPHHSAWGLYGDDDQLGTLNRLTDERVAAAARTEIKTGQRISLNLPLNQQPRRSFFQRALFHQELIAKAPRTVNDDVWTFNSQVSTQWDGLRHFAYQKEKLFYGGVEQKQIYAVNQRGEPATVLGIHAWAEHGIVGRGILVDYHSWRTSQSEVRAYDSFDSSSIPLSDLKACLEAQGTEVKFGDILIIRSGFTASWATKSTDEVWDHQNIVPHPFGGVQQSEEMIRWIWDNFSAVAGDQPSFECWPTREDWALHEVLLAGWGCPIGEFFDLEKLAEQCKREGRWSFFISSEPCNVPGGVASPPNVLAIF
ncbi:hypothetical protein F4778DRAFT_135115 [Xylariomycetidae sp. FL2044]|nr:hypothetical protein F4778DRAFT_135115 [Xylariomycetidae sp. FL2044]